MVLRANQAYQGYQEPKVNVGRQGLLEEVSEGSLEPLDPRVTMETKGTLELWAQEVHLVQKGIQEPPRS